MITNNTLDILQSREGKLEVKFAKSDNTNVDKVCLVFIKIPISSSKVNILQKVLRNTKKPPLSKGRLDVQTFAKNSNGVFIGILRIKQRENVHKVTHELATRMDTILQQASTDTNTRTTGES